MKYFLSLLTLFISTSLYADASAFTEGPVIMPFGKIATVEQDVPLNSKHKFKVVFDMGKQSAEGAPNRSLESLARFINMHIDAGVKAKNIDLALVVHGKAAYDVLANEVYKEKFMAANPNHDLLNELLKNRVEIYLCGQTAAYYDIKNTDLHSGVKMSLSAMTAHALLQQKGYTLNPF